MGEMLNVFIGPWAEWLIPRDRISTVVWDHPILAAKELGGSLGYVASGGEFPVATRNDREYVRFTFYPKKRRKGMPTRTLYFGTYDQFGEAVDLSGIDRQAEVSWFASAYPKELKSLTEHFGSKPQLSWGFCAWMS